MPYLVATPLGLMRACFSPRGLVSLRFLTPATAPTPPEAQEEETRLTAWWHQLEQELAAYFRGEKVPFSLPLDLAALSPFHRAVLAATRAIPYGETRTYAEIACSLGRPRAARAVGMALKNNPIGIIIPCHRVIRTDGGLGGYSGLDPLNLARKRYLLRLENAALMTSAAGSV